MLATRRQGWRGFLGRTNGGMIVHLGVVVVAVAIAASGSYVHESEARYAPGQTRTVAGHEITYLDTREVQERNRLATKVRGPGRRRQGLRAGAVAVPRLRVSSIAPRR